VDLDPSLNEDGPSNLNHASIRKRSHIHILYCTYKKNGTRSGKKKIVPDELRMLGFRGYDFSRRASYHRIMIVEPASEDERRARRCYSPCSRFDR
jgi:hypothetical protein